MRDRRRLCQDNGAKSLRLSMKANQRHLLGMLSSLLNVIMVKQLIQGSQERNRQKK